MDLDQMKNTWKEMSEERMKHSLLSEEQIRRMTHEKSSSSLYTLILSESIGAMMALAMIIYLTLNFYKLEGWLEQAAGYGTLTILIISVFMGGKLIREMYSINIQRNTYSTTLQNFQRLKKSLRFYKRFSISISFLVPFLILPVVARIWFNKSLLEDWADYRENLLVAFIVLPVILYLIMRFYKKNVTEVGKALKEMNEE